MEFPKALLGGIWHTTKPEHFKSILKDRFIFPEGPIPDSERWGTTKGSHSYPFVRSINGISLFDFRAFDEGTYSNQYPNSMWKNFVPYTQGWDTAIWIEIDISKVNSNFIDGKALLVQRKKQKQYNRKIMPLIEAAHIGPLPKQAFRQILTYSRDIGEFNPLSIR